VVGAASKCFKCSVSVKPAQNSRPKSPNKTSRKALLKNLLTIVPDAPLNSTKKINVPNAPPFKLAYAFSVTSKTTLKKKPNFAGNAKIYNPMSTPKIRKNNNTSKTNVPTANNSSIHITMSINASKNLMNYVTIAINLQTPKSIK
jgi:hypothetical protein